MAIEVNGRKYQTLSDNMYVNGDKVYQAHVNNKKVYPDGRKPITEGQGMYALVFGHYTLRQTHEHDDENATYEITRPIDFSKPFTEGRVVTAYEVRHHHSATYEFSLGFVTALKAAYEHPFNVRIGGYTGPWYGMITDVDEDTNSVDIDYEATHASLYGYYDPGTKNLGLNLACSLYGGDQVVGWYNGKTIYGIRFMDDGPIDGDYPFLGFDRLSGYVYDGGYEVLGDKYEYETSGPNACGPVYMRIEEVHKVGGRVYPPASYYHHVTATCGDFYDIAKIHGAERNIFKDGIIQADTYDYFALYGKTDVTCTVVNSGDLNNDYIEHNTQTLMVACAPVTDILYIGDDPGMASVDRVEIVKNGKDYTYRLLD